MMEAWKSGVGKMTRLRMLFSVALGALLVLVPGACSRPAAVPVEELPPPLLLVSIDGFRHDYFDRAETPALDRLVYGGLKADALVHVFPTKTFSTHYSLVTGLYAENTGVVANAMWDPRRRASFSLRNRDAVSDGFWYDGEPIWVTAENQGLKAATYFWPGSEARIRNVRPTWWKPYAGGTSHAERIEQVLTWLDKPAGEGPSLITLYFSRVDSLGHRHGPDAVEIDQAIAAMDQDLATLLDGLDERGLTDRMNILLVSDHGMAGIHPERTIMLDEYLDLSKVRVSDWGPAAQIWAEGMEASEIVDALHGAHPRMRVWAREDIPERYGFRDHPRIADVLAEADLGWMISNRPYMAAERRYPLRGMHGWDPWHEQMGGILVAHGPAFPPGTRMPRVESIHLYELMARLLGLDPAANDGKPDVFAGHVDVPGFRDLESPAPPPVLYGDRDHSERPVIGLQEAWQNRAGLAGEAIALEAAVDPDCDSPGCLFKLAEKDLRVPVEARDGAFTLGPSGNERVRVFGELVLTEAGEAGRLVADAVMLYPAP